MVCDACVFSDDPAGDFSNTRMVLQELGVHDVSLDDCRHVQHVCWQVSQRAASLAATGPYTITHTHTHTHTTVDL